MWFILCTIEETICESYTKKFLFLQNFIDTELRQGWNSLDHGTISMPTGHIHTCCASLMLGDAIPLFLMGRDQVLGRNSSGKLHALDDPRGQGHRLANYAHLCYCHLETLVSWALLDEDAGTRGAQVQECCPYITLGIETSVNDCHLHHEVIRDSIHIQTHSPLVYQHRS